MQPHRRKLGGKPPSARSRVSVATKASEWELPKTRGTLFLCLYTKDPDYLGYYIRVPYFRKLPNRFA